MFTSTSNEDQDISPNEKRIKKVGLPWRQLGVLLLLLLAEPMTATTIYPFIAQLVIDLKITTGEKSNIGYYVGLVESLFFLTEACFILQWGRLSDRIGRKPVLITGLFGLALSMACFGLSRSFIGVIVSRAIAGALNGNVGVIKSAIGEIVDGPNLARAFSYIPLTWAIGTTFAPLMGGYLSRPAEQFPNLFTSPFWIKYPYFLPCAVAACFSLFCAIMTLILFQETHPTLGKPREDLYERVETGSRASLDKEQEESLLPAESSEKPIKQDAPIPLRTLLTRKIVLSVINYHILAILEISMISVMPVFFASCLHMEPSSIGLIMGAMGFVNGIIQITCFVPLHRRLGTRNIFTFGLTSFLLIWCCFPLINQFYAQDEGVVGFKISAMITILILLSTLEQMSFNVIFLYVKASAPSPSALGATNGVAQTVASIARAIGPAGSTSLFAASLQHPNILGGNMVYWVLAGITVAGIVTSLKLPSEPWEGQEENELQLRNEERDVDE